MKQRMGKYWWRAFLIMGTLGLIAPLVNYGRYGINLYVVFIALLNFFLVGGLFVVLPWLIVSGLRRLRGAK